MLSIDMLPETNPIIEPTAEDLPASGRLLLTTKFGALDVLDCITKGQGFGERFKNSTEIGFHGYTFSVLNLETILELKRDSQDSRDRQFLPIYEETMKLIRDKSQTLKTHEPKEWRSICL